MVSAVVWIAPLTIPSHSPFSIIIVPYQVKSSSRVWRALASVIPLCPRIRTRDWTKSSLSSAVRGSMICACEMSTWCSLARLRTFSRSPRMMRSHMPRARSSPAAVITRQSSPSGRTIRCRLALAAALMWYWKRRDVISLRTSLPPTMASMNSVEALAANTSDAAWSLRVEVGSSLGARPCNPWIRCVAWKVSSWMERTGTRQASPGDVRIVRISGGRLVSDPSVRRMPEILGNDLDLAAMRRDKRRSTRPMCVTISTDPPDIVLSGDCWVSISINCEKVTKLVPSRSSMSPSIISTSVSETSSPRERITKPISKTEILSVSAFKYCPNTFLHSSTSSSGMPFEDLPNCQEEFARSPPPW
mmetsp:Transcript_65916/g.157299  ORF Transcript_65916/g.157299 Transcript_65916/m.157299 type:complete len:360 (-) Transcript_65916:2350-3429(-)